MVGAPGAGRAPCQPMEQRWSSLAGRDPVSREAGPLGLASTWVSLFLASGAGGIQAWMSARELCAGKLAAEHRPPAAGTTLTLKPRKRAALGLRCGAGRQREGWAWSGLLLTLLAASEPVVSVWGSGPGSCCL